MFQPIRGVDHDVLPGNAFDYHATDRRIEGGHPLGDVFVQGDHGYVANGYYWLRFPIDRLGEINDANEDDENDDD